MTAINLDGTKVCIRGSRPRGLIRQEVVVGEAIGSLDHEPSAAQRPDRAPERQDRHAHRQRPKSPLAYALLYRMLDDCAESLTVRADNSGADGFMNLSWLRYPLLPVGF